MGLIYRAIKRRTYTMSGQNFIDEQRQEDQIQNFIFIMDEKTKQLVSSSKGVI